MTESTSPHSNDAPNPKDINTQASESPVNNAESGTTAMADGECKDTRMLHLEVNALLMLDKDTHAIVPDDIKQGLKTYFETTGFKCFVELPDVIVRLDLFGFFGEWDGKRVRYVIDVKRQGETYEVPLLFTSELDVDTLVDHCLKRKPSQGRETAAAGDTPEARSTTDGDTEADPCVPPQDLT